MRCLLQSKVGKGSFGRRLTLVSTRSFGSDRLPNRRPQHAECNVARRAKPRASAPRKAVTKVPPLAQCGCRCHACRSTAARLPLRRRAIPRAPPDLGPAACAGIDDWWEGNCRTDCAAINAKAAKARSFHGKSAILSLRAKHFRRAVAARPVSPTRGPLPRPPVASRSRAATCPLVHHAGESSPPW